MAASGKAQYLDKIHGLLAKRYKLGRPAPRMTVLEAALFGICHEGATRVQANQALSRFKDEFFDWNELRVSSVREIEDALMGLPHPEEKARRVRRFLRQLFERTYGFDLERLTKKPLKEAIKILREFEAGQSDFVIGTVIQEALGGHALPIDEPSRRCLARLEVIDDSTSAEAARSTLEHAIPKSRGAQFTALLEELAHDTCVQGEPNCPPCALVKLCPTGQRVTAERAAEAKRSKKSARQSQDGAPTKPKASRGRSPRPK